MPTIYIADETKRLLEIVTAADKRTQDGEIAYLCEERAKVLKVDTKKEE